MPTGTTSSNLILNMNLTTTRVMTVLIALVIASFSAQAQIEINEIDFSGTVPVVELKNNGSTSEPIGSWWLCNFPWYERVQDLPLVAGTDLTLDPGEIIVVEATSFTLASDGEMGIYTTNSFGNPAAIRDYVEWGTPAHFRAGTAATAGLWTVGDFVPTVPSGQSLNNNGDGGITAATYYLDAPTIGAENNPPSSCDITDVPDGLSAVQTGISTMLSWNAPSGAVACQLKAQRLPSGPAPSVNLTSAPINMINVSNALTGAGSMWEYEVRCACSIAPLEVTDFSAPATFSVPAPRAAEKTIQIVPNPASSFAQLTLENDRVSQIEIFDLSGRTMLALQGTGTVQLNLSNFETGIYLVEVNGQYIEKLLVD